MTAKKIAGTLHLWLGLLSGLVIFILGLTGCLYCFETELRQVFYKDRLYADEQRPAVLPLDSLNAIAAKALGGDKPVNSVEIRAAADRTYAYLAYQYNPDANTYGAQLPYFITVYVNPYTGKVQCVEDTKHEFFRIVLALHYDLMLGKAGHVIVPWACAVFVAMLLTGIVLWWPKNKAAAKQRFWFRWKKTTRWKRKNYDLHNVTGFYSLFPALILALTGLVFGFAWFSNGLKRLADGKTKTATPAPVFSDTASATAASPYATAYRYLAKEERDAQRFLFLFPVGKAATLNVLAYRHADRFYRQNSHSFDRYTGKWLRTQPYGEQSAGDKLTGANYDVHVGKIIGLPGEILAFLASLIAALLPVTGFLIWAGRRRKGAKKKPVETNKAAQARLPA